MSTTDLFRKHFGGAQAVSLKHPNIENFFNELNTECLNEDLEKQKIIAMTVAQQIEKIAELLTNDFSGLVKFSDVILIKTSPHVEIARIYGAAVNLYDGKEVWLLDADGEWYRLDPTDRNVEYVTASVLQRLKYLKMFAKTEEMQEKN